MGMQQLLLLSAVILVLGNAAEEPDSTNIPTRQQAWRESEHEAAVYETESDSLPSASQDTRSNYQGHPNNGPLIEQERPRQRSRSRSNGKRRRRMRKRPRTTTLEPFADEIWEEQPQSTDDESALHRPRFQSERIHDGFAQYESTINPDEIKSQPQRRPSKRRRPHRRPTRIEELTDEPIRLEPIGERQPTESRKRRKGNRRKRPRVETEPPILDEELKSPPTNPDEPIIKEDYRRKRPRIETERPILDEEPKTSPTLTETYTDDPIKEGYGNKENEPKGFTEMQENPETITESVEKITLPSKRQRDQQKQPLKANSTKETNTEFPSVLKENNEDQQLSSSQSSENHHTEIHYSTTYSTRRTSDQNTESTRNSQTSTNDITKIIRTTDPTLESSTQTTKLQPLRFTTKHKLHSRINNSTDTLKIRTTTEQPDVQYNTENLRKVTPLNEEQEVNRKTTYSSSKTRRLPPTSAIIRRKLKTKGKNDTISSSATNNDTESSMVTTTASTSTSTHLNTEKKILQNTQDQIINRLAYRNEIEPSTLLPEGFKTHPEILSPMKLLEEVTINEVLKMMTSTTERTEDDEYNKHTTVRMLNNSNNSDRLNLDGIELPNIRDEILELIKSESGISRVARILELRNMTLKELLDHRERGSSQLHFSENTNKKQNVYKTTTSITSSRRKTTATEPVRTTTTTTTTTTSTTQMPTAIVTSESTRITPKTVKPLVTRKPKTTTSTTENILSETRLEEAATTFDVVSREKPTLKVEASVMSVPILEPTHTSSIQFPEQGVLGSFPKFLIDTLQHEERLKIQKHQKFNTTFSSTPKPKLFVFKTETSDDTDKREPRVFESMPEFPSNRTELKSSNKFNKSSLLSWKSQFHIDNVKPFRGEHKELIIAITSTGRPRQIDVDDVVLFNEKDDPPRNNAAGKISADTDRETKDEDYSEMRRLPPGVKSAILASGAILGLAILGFLTVLVSCRLRQRNARMRGRRDILCEQLQEDFRSSQCSLSPVLNKSHRAPVFGQGSST